MCHHLVHYLWKYVSSFGSLAVEICIINLILDSFREANRFTSNKTNTAHTTTTTNTSTVATVSTGVLLQSSPLPIAIDLAGILFLIPWYEVEIPARKQTALTEES
jgi:hypothetical protein